MGTVLPLQRSGISTEVDVIDIKSIQIILMHLTRITVASISLTKADPQAHCFVCVCVSQASWNGPKERELKTQVMRETIYLDLV